jgi:hypothetical protein
MLKFNAMCRGFRINRVLEHSVKVQLPAAAAAAAAGYQGLVLPYLAQ